MMCQLAEREKIFDQQNQPEKNEKNPQFFFSFQSHKVSIE